MENILVQNLIATRGYALTIDDHQSPVQVEVSIAVHDFLATMEEEAIEALKRHLGFTFRSVNLEAGIENNRLVLKATPVMILPEE